MASLCNNLSCTLLLLLVALIIVLTPAVEANTRYSIFIHTGNVINGGTDSKIGIHLYNKTGAHFYIEDLETWGRTKEDRHDHDHFESDSYERFRGYVPVLSGKVCKIELVSDGSGHKPGWYASFVVVHGGTSLSYKYFKIYQWLEPPKQLSTVRDECVA